MQSISITYQYHTGNALTPGNTSFKSYINYYYGFNGYEGDPEVKGQGNSYTTEFRQYDPRLGRWLSLDPLMGKYPWMSPYAAFNNNPIYFTDPLGLEGEPPGLPECNTDENGAEVDWKNGDEYTDTWGSTWHRDEDMWLKESKVDMFTVIDSRWRYEFEEWGEFVRANPDMSRLEALSTFPIHQVAQGKPAPMHFGITKDIFLTTLSLDLSIMEASLKGAVDAEKLLREGKFEVEYNGKTKQYSIKFHGNQSVPATLIKEAKVNQANLANLATETKPILKLANGAGLILNVYSVGSTVHQITEDGELNMETTMDLAFGAIGFYGLPGTVISGAYFLVLKPIAKYGYQKAVNMGASFDNYGVVPVE